MLVNKKYLRLSSIGVVIIGILALRIFYLPGLVFNQGNWDDEISWMNDSTTRSPTDQIFDWAICHQLFVSLRKC